MTSEDRPRPPLPPLKRLGQHFLVDRRAIDAIVPASGEAVVEIGPGRGALTWPLLDRLGRLTAIEVDRGLASWWREHGAADGLNLVEGDARDIEWPRLAADLGVRDLVVVSNLPYSISKPLARGVGRSASNIRRAVLMFQKEVAARLLAGVGERDYGPLAILVAESFRVRRAFDLGPGAFRPPPRVRSTVTVWDRRPVVADAARLAALERVLGAGFAHPRKRIDGNLSRRFGRESAVEALDRAGLAGSERPAAIEPAAWRLLAESLTATDDVAG